MRVWEGKDGMQGRRVRILLELAGIMTLLPLLAGCAGSNAFIQPNVDFSHIHRCAILPFQNLTNDGFADERLESIFLMEVLQDGSLAMVDPEETVSAMNAQHVTPGVAPTPEQIVSLGKTLSVDAVFMGSVEEYGLQSQSRQQIYGVTAVFSMAETETGNLIWRSQVHVAGSSIWKRIFGGESASLYDISKTAVRRALADLL
jgi:hypothetical protein